MMHRRYKFTPDKLKKVQSYYEDCGWKVEWIARYFQVHRGAILFHVRTKGWIRRARLLEILPEKIARIYRRKEKKKYLDNTYSDTKKIKRKLVKGSYEYIRNISEQQRLKNCQHIRWIKRCSFCGKILESDSINHQQFHNND